jgi:HSP20 family protein
MALVRFDPAFEVDSLQSEMNRVFDGFFGTRVADRADGGRWIPAMDLAEAEDEFVLTADLPGMGEDDISIEVKDNVLQIAGERTDLRERKDRGYHRVERSFGRFSRSLGLPEGVDADRIEASFDKGVLEVHIPKPEERKPHRVRIGSGGGREALEGEGSEKS